VEAGSRDDFYLDFGKTNPIDRDFRGTLLRLQTDVFDQTGLSISLGAAGTRVVAEIASQIDGPRGFRIVSAHRRSRIHCSTANRETARTLEPSYASLLAASGAQTIAALRRVPRPALMAGFGERLGERIWNAARGRDFSDKLLAAQRSSIFARNDNEGGTIDPEHLPTNDRVPLRPS